MTNAKALKLLLPLPMKSAYLFRTPALRDMGGGINNTGALNRHNWQTVLQKQLLVTAAVTQYKVPRAQAGVAAVR